VNAHCKCLFISTLSICVVVFAQTGTALASNDGCTFPQGLREQVSRKYPGTALVTLADLNEDDRKFFQGDHGNQCPGLVRVDFYGDGKPTWALVLISGERSKSTSRLVVARQIGAGWHLHPLDTRGTDVPVVWSQDPGKYRDVYGNKQIRATNPVIVFCRYESWAILYAWTGKRVEKIWIMD
jgi:hypothetical protein